MNSQTSREELLGGSNGTASRSYRHQGYVWGRMLDCRGSMHTISTRGPGPRDFYQIVLLTTQKVEHMWLYVQDKILSLMPWFGCFSDIHPQESAACTPGLHFCMSMTCTDMYMSCVVGTVIMPSLRVSFSSFFTWHFTALVYNFTFTLRILLRLVGKV